MGAISYFISSGKSVEPLRSSAFSSFTFCSSAPTGSILSPHRVGSKCKSYHRYVISVWKLEWSDLIWSRGRGKKKNCRIGESTKGLRERSCSVIIAIIVIVVSVINTGTNLPGNDRRLLVGARALCVFVPPSLWGRVEERVKTRGEFVVLSFFFFTQPHTHTCELQGVKAANPLACAPAAREAMGETGKKR